MHVAEETALFDLIVATMTLLDHRHAPNHVICIEGSAPVAYDVVVYAVWHGKRAECRRLRFTGGTASVVHDAIKAVAALQDEFEIHEDFVFRRVEGAYQYASWILVYGETLHARYVSGASVPVTRGYATLQ